MFRQQVLLPFVVLLLAPPAVLSTTGEKGKKRERNLWSPRHDRGRRSSKRTLRTHKQGPELYLWGPWSLDQRPQTSRLLGWDKQVGFVWKLRSTWGQHRAKCSHRTQHTQRTLIHQETCWEVPPAQLSSVQFRQHLVLKERTVPFHSDYKKVLRRFHRPVRHRVTMNRRFGTSLSLQVPQQLA